jgi:NADH-quinone oxidoreductase subunit C
MSHEEIYNNLKTEYGDAVVSFNNTQEGDSYIEISKDKSFEICHTLRDKEVYLFDYMMSLSGVDCGENICAVYHLYSMTYKHKLVLKVFAPKINPEIDSVERIWKTADWHEREAFDLMGIVFLGHRNLKRILLPEDWEGHPLRKDYKAPEYYHGMKVS